MAVDLQRILEAAAQAAVADSGANGSSGRDQNKSTARRGRRGLTGAKAFLIGAGAVTAGRLVVAARRGDLLDGLQQRLLEYEHRHFADAEDEEPPEELDDEELDDEDLDDEELNEEDLDDEDLDGDELDEVEEE